MQTCNVGRGKRYSVTRIDPLEDELDMTRHTRHADQRET